MPDEILLQIFDHLFSDAPITDTATISSVSIDWNKIINDEDFWHRQWDKYFSNIIPVPGLSFLDNFKMEYRHPTLFMKSNIAIFANIMTQNTNTNPRIIIERMHLQLIEYCLQSGQPVILDHYDRYRINSINESIVIYSFIHRDIAVGPVAQNFAYHNLSDILRRELLNDNYLIEEAYVGYADSTNNNIFIKLGDLMTDHEQSYPIKTIIRHKECKSSYVLYKYCD